ncbi:MAG: prephenate dehydrogenase [Anaerolineae bacterium]|nr:prephenate dehydrogenase [Anaerolineae bacterium]
MAKTKISIVGLGLVGTSVGLALSQGTRNYDIVGHDKEPKAAGEARRRKAVDSTDWNLINACEGASIVILALPVTAIRDTLQVIAPYLREGCLVTDTASLKTPVLQWAEELLPEGVHFVGGDPVISAAGAGAEEASADLLKNALYCLCPSPRAAPDAVRLASGLVERLGAQPYFLDAAEHDGLMAAVDHLPAVLAAVLLRSTTGGGSWRDMRKLAGGQYESSTQFASETPAVFRDACLYNRQNIVRWIDAYTAALQEWKEMIIAGSVEQVEAAFEEVMQARLQWLRQRSSGLWEEAERPEVPRPPGFFQSLFGLGGRSRP